MNFARAIQEPLPKPPVTKAGGAPLGADDARNLCFVLLGFVVALILVPPVRTYPMGDDWAYAQSVSRLLAFNYRPHDWIQPTSLGHLIWGALFSLVFGYSFTTLTAATLLISAACLAVFYLLLRHLSVTSQPALVGTALLGFNPIYVYLSYSFMTDIAFVLYLLAGCLFYLRAIQSRGDYWFVLGSIATALAYLTRQHGIMLAPALLFFLWRSKQLSWHKALLSFALPLATAAVYMAWERTQPAPLVNQLVAQVMDSRLSDPVGSLWLQLRRSVVVLQMPGLCLIPLVFYFRPRHPILGMPIFLSMFYFQFNVIQVFGTAFPAFGSLVDHTGLLMYDYAKQPLWSEQLWTLLAILGTLSMSLFVANCFQDLCKKLRTPRLTATQAQEAPVVFVYTAGLLLSTVTFASPFLFDRYLLPILPILMLYPLRRMSVQTVDPSKARWHFILVCLLVAPIALFSFFAIHDFHAHARARWRAAERLVSSGVKHQQVDAGFEWMGWYLFDAGVARIRHTGDLKWLGEPYRAALDPIFLVSDLPRPGYVKIDSVPYESWLSGRQVYDVLILRREKIPKIN